MEEKERYAFRWRMCRESLKLPVTRLSCQQVSHDTGRQRSHRSKRLGRRKLWSRGDCKVYRSYYWMLATGGIRAGLVTLELHGAAALGYLRFRH
jgi:hypothetical protein